MEPYEIIDCPESPSGKAIVLRGKQFFLGERNGFSDEVWLAKLQAKADYLGPRVKVEEE